MPPPRALPSPGLAAVLALAGCSGPDDDAGFTFTLTPSFLGGQDVLAGEPDAELLIARPGSAAELVFLGTASEGGELSLPEVDPFEAGTVVGLLLEDGGQPDQWDPKSTVAYGQVTLDEVPAADATVEVLVPALAELGEVGALASAKQRYCAAAAIVPGGDVFLFGGREPTNVSSGMSSDRISVLAGTDAGETDFEQIDEKIPETELTSGGRTGGRCAATATAVTVEGEPRILLAGGRPNWSELDPIRTWHLFDPVAGEFVKKGEMHLAHSGHLAVPFAGGSVLLFAGIGLAGWPQAPRYDVWEPTAAGGRTIAGTDDTSIVTGLINVMGAPLGDDVVVCGGVNDIGDIDHFVWDIKAGCNRARPNGRLEAFDPMPVPVAAGAMAELPGGGLLVTGGFNVVITDDLVAPVTIRNTPAVDTVWLYDPSDGWKGTGATLIHARAHHRMVPLPDGRVLVVGGTTEGTGLNGNLSEPVDCPELYDPVTGFFTEMACVPGSGGADPLVASAPGEGAFVYEGFTRNGPIYDGHSRYGFVATGPPPLE